MIYFAAIRTINSLQKKTRTDTHDGYYMFTI